MVSKLQGNAVVSNKESKYLFLCLHPTTAGMLLPMGADFCKTDLHLVLICNIITVLLLVLLILGRFHHFSLLAFPFFIFRFLFLDAFDTFSSCSLEFSLFFSFSCSCNPFIASFPIKDYTSSCLFSPADEEQPNFFLQETPPASESLDYSLSRNFLTSASLIAPTNCEIAVALRNAITVGRARTLYFPPKI